MNQPSVPLQNRSFYYMLIVLYPKDNLFEENSPKLSFSAGSLSNFTQFQEDLKLPICNSLAHKYYYSWGFITELLKFTKTPATEGLPKNHVCKKYFLCFRPLHMRLHQCIFRFSGYNNSTIQK